VSDSEARQVVGVMRDAKGRMTHVVGVDGDGSRWTRRAEEIAGDAKERWFYVAPGGESFLVSVRLVEGEFVLWNALEGWVQVPEVPR
jgi:hypothetical protein